MCVCVLSSPHVEGAAREERLALRAARLAESMHNFHGVSPDGSVTGYGPRQVMDRAGLGQNTGGEGGTPGMHDGRTRGGGGGGGGLAGADKRGGGDADEGQGEGEGDGDDRGALDEVVAAELRLHPFFSTFRKSEVDAVRRRSRRFSVAMGQRMFRQGDPGSSMFIVAKGIAMVFLEDHLGRRTKIDELTSGHSIGEGGRGLLFWHYSPEPLRFGPCGPCAFCFSPSVDSVAARRQ